MRRLTAAGLAFAIAILVAGCGGPVGDNAAPTPTAGEADDGTASSAPSVAEPKPLNVKTTARTKSVRRGGTASVTIRTTPGARCLISVVYPSGPATAGGLDARKAGKTGFVVWTWKVGAKTTKGSMPIYVTCSLRDRTGDVTTSFMVK